MTGDVTITPGDLSSGVGTTPLQVRGYASASDVLLQTYPGRVDVPFSFAPGNDIVVSDAPLAKDGWYILGLRRLPTGGSAGSNTTTLGDGAVVSRFTLADAAFFRGVDVCRTRDGSLGGVLHFSGNVGNGVSQQSLSVTDVTRGAVCPIPIVPDLGMSLGFTCGGLTGDDTLRISLGADLKAASGASFGVWSPDVPGMIAAAPAVVVVDLRNVPDRDGCLEWRP